jgi:formamidopyrimidine-DNA glycosylase
VPELPDLEVTKEILQNQLLGYHVIEVLLQNPVLLRRPTAEQFKQKLLNAEITAVTRYGKFLILQFHPLSKLFINPMLAGEFSIKHPSDRIPKKLGFLLRLTPPASETQVDLRFIDTRSMSKLYLLGDNEPTALIPTFDEQGPDALDPNLSLEEFIQRIRRFNAVIKHVLTNQRFIAGIGNAYADEILFEAQLFPWRKRSTLSESEIEKLYNSIGKVLHNAITIIRDRTGTTLPRKIRDFLMVHGKGKQPCPTCGTLISSVKSGIKMANFCRQCQR